MICVAVERRSEGVVSPADGCIVAICCSWGVVGHLEKILERECKPSVALLVVELELPLPVVRMGENAVVLSYAHPASQNVTRWGAWIHGEAARVDDVDSAVGRDVWPSAKALYTVDSLGDIGSLFWGHSKLKGELGVAEEEVWHRPAPAFELRLGFLDEDVEGVLILLYEAKKVYEFPAHLCWGFVLNVVALAHGFLVGRGEDKGDMDVQVVGLLDAAHELLELIAEILTALV